MKKGGLGKGLSALISTTIENITEELKNEDILEVDIKLISTNKDQPRKIFNEEKIQELANSISEHGIIQPIIVHKNNEKYEIIAGERRYRAAQKAGLKKVPVIVKNYTAEQICEIALIENIQRENLNSIEEAEAYKRLADTFLLTQEQIAKKLGKNRSTVANIMRLLQLDTNVKTLIQEGKISNGHARCLISISDHKKQLELANKIINENLNVRDTEKLVKQILEPQKQAQKTLISKPISTEYKNIQTTFQQILGTKVSIIPGKKKNKIEIEYYSDEDLERIIEIIQNK